MTDIGTLPGDTLSKAVGINGVSEVIGNSWNPGSPVRSFLYSDSNMLNLGIPFGGVDNIATGINNLGEVVGYYDTSGGEQHAYVETNGQIVDLASLLPAGSGWGLLERATAINNFGQIVGFGLLNGQSADFLMTPTGAPVPLPSAVWLFVCVGTARAGQYPLCTAGLSGSGVDAVERWFRRRLVRNRADHARRRRMLRDCPGRRYRQAAVR